MTTPKPKISAESLSEAIEIVDDLIELMIDEAGALAHLHYAVEDKPFQSDEQSLAWLHFRLDQLTRLHELLSPSPRGSVR